MGVLDSKRQAELDQGAKMLTENFPPLIRGMYDGLLKCGFNESQAIELTKAYIVALTRTTS